MPEFYGEWRDGPLTTEVHDAATGVVDRSTNYPVADPAPSGWFIGGWKSYFAGAQATKSTEGPLGSPPPADPGVSMQAWDLARNTPTSDNQPGLPDARVEHHGRFIHNIGIWTQEENWDLWGSYWHFAYARPSNTDWIAAVAPPFEEWPAGAVTVEVEQPGPQSAFWIELDSASVFGSGTPDYPLYHKAPAAGTWFADVPADPHSIATSTAGREVTTDTPLSVELLEPFVVEAVASGLDPHDPRLPSGAVARNPDWPGAYGPGSWSHYYDGSHEGGYGGAILNYRPPRWRYVYDRPLVAAPRRVFPREDALTGGARRVYPPPKSEQRGFRAGPGSYL